jgi:hypothetical protein
VEEGAQCLGREGQKAQPRASVCRPNGQLPPKAPVADVAVPTRPRLPLCAQVASLDPSTHAYSFWEGVPRDGKAAFGRLFRRSQTLKVRRAQWWRALARSAPAQGTRCERGASAWAGPEAVRGCQQKARACRAHGAHLPQRPSPSPLLRALSQAVAVVQRAIRNIDPCLEMQQLGFGPLLLIKSFAVNMSGRAPRGLPFHEQAAC